MQVINEALYGIRAIKLSAWESLFSQRIAELRSAEVQSLAARKYLDALCVFFWAATPVLISLLTFLTYVLLGNHLTAAKVCIGVRVVLISTSCQSTNFNALLNFAIIIKSINAFT